MPGMERKIIMALSKDEQLRALYMKNRARAVFAIFKTWIIVIFLQELILYSQVNYLAGAAAFILIGALQNNLLILVHEAAHYLLLDSRKINDFIGNVFCAYPIMITVAGYRAEHFPHHRCVNCESDPSFREHNLPAMVNGFVQRLLYNACGPKLYESVIKYLFPNPQNNIKGVRKAFYIDMAGRLLVQSAIGGYFILRGMPWNYFIFWLLPLISVSITINYIRTNIEHTPLIGELEQNSDDHSITVPSVTRSVSGNIISRFFLAPLNFNYHFEHHLFPNIPFHNLPKLKVLLKDKGYGEELSSHYCESYGKIIFRLAKNYAKKIGALKIRLLKESAY